MSSFSCDIDDLVEKLKTYDKPITIGLCGYGGVGKDEVAKYLVEHYGFVQVSFAAPLRELAAHINPHFPQLGKTYNEVVAEVGYDEAKKRYPDIVRDYLVKLGEGGRRFISPTIWIDAARERAKGHPRVVFSDVRYDNERKLIVEELGGTIWYISRTDCGPANETEAASVPMIIYNAIIFNNDSLDKLHNSINFLLQSSI